MFTCERADWQKNFLLLGATTAVASFSSVTEAAEISHVAIGEKGEQLHVISLDGEIVSGDEGKFRKLSLQYPNAVVFLDSPGGQLLPALEIGKIIRISGYATFVMDGAKCASSCALIWMAGRKKLLDPAGKVGFHAAYRSNDGKLTESGLANALVGQYLTLMDYRTKAIAFATSAPPDGIRWLNSENKELSGIDFDDFVLDPEKQKREAAMPPQVRTIRPAASAATSFGEGAYGVQILKASSDSDDSSGETKTYRFKYKGFTLDRSIPATSSPGLALKEMIDAESDEDSGWVFYTASGTTSKDTIFYYANPESLKVMGKSKTVWTKRNHEYDYSVTYRDTLLFYNINCEYRTMQVLEYTNYDKSGKVLDAFKEPSRMERAIPNTVGEALVDTVCP